MVRRNIRRGQPGNAGQFASGTAGQSAPTPSPVAAATPRPAGASDGSGYLEQYARLVVDSVAAAEDRSTSAEDLERLARHPDPQVRMRVAYHDNSNRQTQDLLSRDDHAGVRQFVAANTREVDVLHRLAVDEDPAVRETARQNPGYQGEARGRATSD